jgi:hypothetical protein
MASLQNILHCRTRNIVAPNITRISGHLRCRCGGPFGAIGAAEVHDSNAGCRRQ